MRRHPGQTPEDDALNGPLFGGRIFSLHNTASIFLTLIVLYLVYQELFGLDWREAWASVRGTNVGLFALAAALLTTAPITPAGLGFTEGGMIFMLQWLGLDAYTASAVTLLFRVINYWSIVVFGFLIYVSSRNDKRLTEERLVLHG